MKSKNVLIAISHLATGGTEIQTLNLVKALIDGGYNVTVLCLFRHIESMITQYKSIGAKIYLASPQYDRYGIDIKYPKKLKLLFFLYKHLRRIIRKEKIDIVHVQYMTPAATIILVLRYLLFQKNIIATVHTAADIYKDLRLIHFIQRHCVRAFTCITELAERSFFGTSQLYTPETKLKKRNHFTIHNCLKRTTKIEQRGKRSFDNTSSNRSQVAQILLCPVGCEERMLSTEQRTTNNVNRSSLNSKPSTLNSKPECFTLGVVSRLEKIKGMDLVVPAFAEVLKQHPDTRLIVVGDGSLRSIMEQQATELGCSDYITWTGRQPQDELANWYSQMNIVLMPSRSEGFGLTAIEAMSNGCVVVASNVGGLPEVVRDGECGLLHHSEDATDMAEKISLLINDKETYNRLQAQSINEVEKYSFEHYAELINDMYNKCKV